MRPYVACYWTLLTTSAEPHRVLPDGCMDLIFDLRRGRSAVIGAMTTAVLERSDAFDALGVRFRPGEGSAVLGIGAREMTDRAVPLLEVWGVDELGERVAEAQTLAARLRILDDALSARLGARRADWRIRRAVAQIEAAGGAISVAAVAAEVRIGERQLERLFADRVGIGPKRFARVIRLQRVLQRLRDPAVDLTTIAIVGGFSDPSHVIREVRDLCGVTPSGLVAKRAMSDPSNRPAASPDTGRSPNGGDRWSAR